VQPAYTSHGAPCEVEWAGDWWSATVAAKYEHTLRVSYVGGTSDDDEWIPEHQWSSRIRAVQEDEQDDGVSQSYGGLTDTQTAADWSDEGAKQLKIVGGGGGEEDGLDEVVREPESAPMYICPLGGHVTEVHIFASTTLLFTRSFGFLVFVLIVVSIRHYRRNVTKYQKEASMVMSAACRDSHKKSLCIYVLGGGACSR